MISSLGPISEIISFIYFAEESIKIIYKIVMKERYKVYAEKFISIEFRNLLLIESSSYLFFFEKLENINDNNKNILEILIPKIEYITKGELKKNNNKIIFLSHL